MLPTNEILLIEDHPIVTGAFDLAFPDGYDWCRSVAELTTRFPNGGQWKYAFVDFQLTPDGVEPSTGFGALMHLREHAPNTEIVVFTQHFEQGRRLFTIAAYHWFGTRIIKDKDWVGPRELQKIYDGANTTPRTLLDNYRKHAHLIDGLFARDWWSKAWRVWPEAGGTIPTVQILMRNERRSHNTLEKFRLEAQIAVEHLVSRFYPEQVGEYPDDSRKRANYSSLLHFASFNSNFFSAPELDAVLEFTKPWSRINFRGIYTS